MDRTAGGRYAAFVACSAIWGSTFLAIRVGNDSLPPIWGATLRLLLASLILSALVQAARQGIPRGAALAAAVRYGFFEFGVSLPLLYWGEKTVPSGMAAVLYATVPLSTAFFARLFGLEVLSKWKLGGAGLAIVGVAIIFSGELEAKVSAPALLAVLGAATSAALGSVSLKRGPAQPALASNAIGSAVGAVLCFAGSTLAGEPQVFPRSSAEWFPVLYLTVAGSVVAFVLFAWLLNHWSATSASFIAVVIPVVALALGACVRHEPLTTAGLTGASLVLLGVAMALRSDRQSHPQDRG